MIARLRVFDVREQLRVHGITLRVTRDREFRVNLRYGREETAYYATDLQDALDTGLRMAERERV